MADGNFSGQIVNFFFGTVLAGLVATGFTYKTWREQTRLDFAKERLADATKTFDNASQLISERIFRSYDVEQHIVSDDSDSFAKRRDKLDSAIANWNLAYADMLQRFQFALEVDDDGNERTYRDVHTADFSGQLDCAKALDDRNRPGQADWSSPSWLLTALHYCFIQTNASRKSDSLRKEKPSPERDADIEKLDKQIDDLDALASHVRVASKTAIGRMRHGVETHSYWEFLKSW